jgi:hypothetical protein
MDERKPRLLVLTDIGGDPDDQQSLVRLLVYANEFHIEGVIPEFWRGKEHGRRLSGPQQQMELVTRVIDAYGAVRENLACHAAGYPSAGRLRGIVKRGMVDVPCSIDGATGDADEIIGEGKDTEGSEWIIRCVDRDDPRPVNIAVWGGPADLAQALWRVHRERSDEQVRRFVSIIRVHAIGDQDVTGPWIRKTFPKLFYILDHGIDGNKMMSVYRGMFLGGDESLTSREWVLRHVRQDHGPLGACYPLETWTGPNPHGCLKEGDTPSWLYFLPAGLNDPARPEWGSWGGRFRRVGKGNMFRDATDTVGGTTHARVTVWRWRPYFQADFQARMDWCVAPFETGNHRPRAVVDFDETDAVLERQAQPGDLVAIDASASTDPDGGRLSFRWWIYREAGTYGGLVTVRGDAEARVAVQVPRDAAGREIHLILSVTDDGDPPLTAFRRVIVRVA